MVNKKRISEFTSYIYIKQELAKLGWNTKNPARNLVGQVYTQQECLDHEEIRIRLLRQKPEYVVKLEEDKFYVIEAKPTLGEIDTAFLEAKKYAEQINKSKTIKAVVISGVAGNDDEAFSKKAEEEGYHTIALLYHAVSAAENIHAANHKAVIEDAGATVPIITPEYKVKTTKENLHDDVDGEAYEAKTMYPDFLKTAETANNQIAVLSLTYAMKTELKHKIFFEQALGDINSNTLNSLPSTYFVCPACGNTYANTAPKHCDFSLTDREKFIVFK